jgi:hypothetical protein
MDREEAAIVLRELLVKCDGALLSSSFSLSATESGGYRLSVNCLLDDPLRKCVNGVAKRHQLNVTEQAGKVTIHR